MAVKLVVPVIDTNLRTKYTTYRNVSEGRIDFTCDPYILGLNQVEVYVNGQFQYPVTDFIEIGPTDIQLVEPCDELDDVLIKVRR